MYSGEEEKFCMPAMYAIWAVVWLVTEIIESRARQDVDGMPWWREWMSTKALLCGELQVGFIIKIASRIGECRGISVEVEMMWKG